MRLTESEYKSRYKTKRLKLSLLPLLTWHQCFICRDYIKNERYYYIYSLSGDRFLGCQACCKDGKDAYDKLWIERFGTGD